MASKCRSSSCRWPLLVPPTSGRPELASDLVSVTKQVIRAAATLGIEEAGTRIMGSAWKPFKAMLSPVVAELERRNPKLFLLNVEPGGTPDAEARKVASQALQEIDRDPEIRRLIAIGFESLDKGQREITQRIEKIVLRLDAIDVSIDNLAQRSDERFERIIRQLTHIQESLEQRRISDSGLVTLNGLMWTVEDNGADISYDEAVTYCKYLRLSGYTDWRLANIVELDRLYDPETSYSLPRGVSGPVHVTTPIRLTSYSVWSHYGRLRRSGAKRDVEAFSFGSGKPFTVNAEFQVSMRALCVRIP